MKTNTKILIAVIITFLIAIAIGWSINDLFSKNNAKQKLHEKTREYEAAMELNQKLQDSLLIERSNNKQLLKVIISEKNQSDEKYKNINHNNLTDHQLDSLRAAFRKKTGG